ncbi:ornithine cyclodeaminase family protein [Halorarius litoreus]|uniref:ornithine cyclodeaminase family protein n=1 Tax=Halorarius litoreus TaxID=2962676 RepID=UPI0020CC2EC9|nr:ornithine cyclodeaminase family protein [Halorarius litoreus]
MPPTILTDDDLDARLSPADAVAAMERALEAYAAGDLQAPPREYVSVGDGDLVFTVGGDSEGFGFRAYQTVGAVAGSQVTCVFAPDGALRGLAVGDRAGILRTSGIGGVAVDHLARDDATTLGLLGSWRHARSQAEAVAAVRDLDRVQVFSPNPDHRTDCATDLDERLDCAVEARDDPEPVVREADVLVCATDATSPVFEADWLQPGTHVSSLGPKEVGVSELPADIASHVDLAVTDSLAQARATDEYVVDHGRLVELGDVVAGTQSGRESADHVTLFCSVGLAGTEVALVRAALD